MTASLDLDLRRFTRPLGGGTHLTVWVALLALIVLGGLRYDNFLSAYNISSFLGYNSMFLLISVGMCLVIMTGGIDLSVGAVAALASVVAALLSPDGLIVALPGGVATGLLVGAINAGLIVGLRLPPFMATLATMLAARGASLVVSDNRAVSVDWGSDFTTLGMNKIGPLVPWTIVIAALVVVVAWYVLERTSLGRTVLAVGGNAEAAHLMGLKTGRALVFVYLFSGACAGLAGVFLASGYGAGQPLEGQGWELAAIASVVVGGTLLTGGMGSIPATVAGALLFGLVFNLLNFENGLGVISLSAYWQSVIRGAFLLVVILLQVRLARPHPTKA
ncbi:Ribose ABC transport system, permease protein RbsC [Rubellimicrobium mesophilum DSM 19309]|uniref:Ribose ABC transport system, permease protein RbsC n=1 Tax=Rubellimicrobium mesophilum DSM 19309 TaxID=442562 RepID=A0A017HMT9_9RHOB|nr:ABC transporter permease [Rubellimicrobium mesophilum]EYD75691.1 Ribose ABC transport system, permease protein RbsC [Rubellimicrobium mesophilum DSM 19309]